jgi:hypothetical protein
MFKANTMPKFFLTAIFLIIATAALPVFGWDDVGHKITAYVAWQRMSPTARERVIAILRQAPEDSDIATYYFQYGPESDEVRQRDYFELVATWADIVRNFGMSPEQRKVFETRYKKYHKGSWHYSDTFWKQVNGKVELQQAPDEGGQAIAKLADFDRVMRDANSSVQDKAIAIAWFMHLAGDIHQPLHTSARVTDLEPKGDQGANLFLLTPANTPRANELTLHWYWDSIVSRNAPLKGDECGRNYLEGLGNKFVKKYPFSAFQNKLELGDYDAWKQESFAYDNTDVFTPDLKRSVEPSAKYRKSAYRIAQRQLVEAGYRLGETFNQIFGK